MIIKLIERLSMVSEHPLERKLERKQRLIPKESLRLIKKC